MRLSLFLLYGCFLQQVSAQLNGHYPFRHVGLSDGLLHSNINAIGQDRQGFIWILSVNGLQRYDGTRFVNYPQVVDHAESGFMESSGMFVDTVGQKIWIGKYASFDILDLHTNVLASVPVLNLLRRDTTYPVEEFMLDNGDKWRVNERGFALFPPQDTVPSVTYANHFQFHPHQGKYHVEDPLTGNFWVHYYGNIICCDVATHRASVVFSLPKNKSGIGARLLMLDSQRNLWISTWTEEFYRYNLDTRKMVTYSLGRIRQRDKPYAEGDQVLIVNAMFEDRQHQVWIGTDNTGLLKYLPERDDFYSITAQENIPDGLKYNYQVRCLYQDRDDNIWVGTDRGVSIFNPYHNPVRIIRHDNGAEASLPKNDINDLIQTVHGEIMVGTWGGGITFFDSAWNFLRVHKFRGPEQLNQVWCFLQKKDGMIWAGTQWGYLHEYNPSAGTFTTIRPPELEGSTVRDLIQDPEGRVMIGLHNGHVTTWDPVTHTFHPLSPNPALGKVPSYPVNHLYLDSRNHVWVTTDADLKEYDPVLHQYTAVYNLGDLPDSDQKQYSLHGMIALHDSILVTGAVYGGLWRFNTHTRQLARFKLPGDFRRRSVMAVATDDAGRIWFTSDQDLFSCDPDGQHLVRYALGNLKLNDVFKAPYFYHLRDGRWVTSSFAELVCFDPVLLENNQENRPEVVISGIQVREKPVYMDSLLAQKKPLVLTHQENFISIEFASLDFNELKAVRYLYRMRDLNEHWIDAGSRQYADYTDLRPGKYVFEVKADNGQQESSLVSMSIIILPPWWETLWFRVLSILSVAGLILYIVRNRIEGIRKQADLQHRMAETEMMALRSQMNPHFIFNCINGIDAMIQRNDKYKATLYLNKFARLIRNVLESSKQNTVALSKDLETLQLYLDLEMFRHPDRFSAEIQADPALMQEDYKVPPLIIQPYVENAILHGVTQRRDHLGKLAIDVRKVSTGIRYTIEDNGVGRAQDKAEAGNAGNGIGMQMSQDRIRLFNEEENASVQVIDLMTDGRPSGTRVIVQLKFQE